jgi:hypothetical protein
MFPKLRPTLFDVMPVLGVVVRFDVVMGLDFDRVGFFRHPLALVLLRGAHRSHRQFETVAWYDVGCGGKRWNDKGESADGDQARSAAKQQVHEENPARQ